MTPSELRIIYAQCKQMRENFGSVFDYILGEKRKNIRDYSTLKDTSFKIAKDVIYNEGRLKGHEEIISEIYKLADKV